MRYQSRKFDKNQSENFLSSYFWLCVTVKNWCITWLVSTAEFIKNWGSLHLPITLNTVKIWKQIHFYFSVISLRSRWLNSPGKHKEIKETQMNTQNTNLGKIHKKHTRSNRTVWTSPGSCAHGKLQMYSINARDYFNCSVYETDAVKRKGGWSKLNVQLFTVKQKQRGTKTSVKTAKYQIIWRH